MTSFKFVFVKRESQDKELSGLVGGIYNWLNDEVEIYLTSIADTFYAWVPSFLKLFKDSFIRECENHCIKLVTEALLHEYIHVSLCRTECPLNKQHYAIKKIEGNKK